MIAQGRVSVKSLVEMFYLNSTLNFGIPSVLVFQFEFYYKVDRLLTGLTAQQKGTTARWYLDKTSLCIFKFTTIIKINQIFLNQNFIFDIWIII